MELRHAAPFAIALIWLSACGGDPVARPDPVVTLRISQPLKMPFHGPGGPGRGPIFISFQWTVTLSSDRGREVTVLGIRTELREAISSTSLAVAVEPEALTSPLRFWEPLVVPQGTAGTFASALYPGEWRGTTSVDIRHPSGRSETLRQAFSFP